MESRICDAKLDIIESCLRKLNSDQCILVRLGGKSGNPVYLVEDRKSSYVMKVFHHQKTQQSEVDSYKFLARHGFHTVKVLKSITDGKYFYIYLEVARGKLLAEVMKDYDRMYNIGFQVGIALRRLHEITRVNILDCVTITELRKMVRFSKVPSDVKDAFLSNPGYFTYVHGDPSPDNFYVDGEDIIFIDSGGIMKNTLTRGKRIIPTGFPACDYYRFIFSTQLVTKRDKILSSYDIIYGFTVGYGSTADIFTEDASIFFSTYWNSVLSRYSIKY
ncbi:Hypothetical protein HVR_LOCUS760 [uncultured virus]|nr:Hypothetical protein HVR_LOCUS760 [uncultured virus]